MDTQEKIKKQNLKFVRNSLINDEYKESLFNRVLNQKYQKTDVQFMQKYLSSNNFKIKSFIIRFLCNNGYLLKNFLGLLEDDKRLLDDFIQLAQSYKDEQVLLELLNEENGKCLDVILAIKNIGKNQLLTSLMFSDNEEIVKLVRKVICNE